MRNPQPTTDSERINTLRARVEELEEALHLISNTKEEYPIGFSYKKIDGYRCSGCRANMQLARAALAGGDGDG